MNIFERALKVIPGGVNSPVRAFRSVGGEPYFVESAKGARVTDTNGNIYIDYVSSWGPMILGHARDEIVDALKTAVEMGTSYGAPTKQEVELAELVCEMMPSIEMLRLVSSGTEAVMSALRLARAFTKRDIVIKFEGCYHGHSDSMLVKSGSGLITFGSPSSPGVPADTTKHTLIAQYNNLDSVKSLFNEYKGKIACVIVEPVAANMGVLLPKDGFLEGLKNICNDDGALLIFDEVITGFRLTRGGAQEYYGVSADLTTLGKIIGGGLPVGAYGGRKEIMSNVSPAGSVYQAGTLSGNPLAVTAGLTTLKILNNTDTYKELSDKAEKLYGGMRENLEKLGLKYAFNSVESLACLFFSERTVDNYESAMTSDTAKYASFFHRMLKRGVALAPAQFEALFLSLAHTDEDIEKTLEAQYECLKNL
jgi:glutamate-1-semialdehyde 2,1-aminomutase